MQLKSQVCVKNRMGLHTRPATSIVKILEKSKSEVAFTYKQETVNARSVLSILTLAVSKNSRLTISVDGIDAQETMNNLTIAFENQFEE